jgi:hypothetical protein
MARKPILIVRTLLCLSASPVVGAQLRRPSLRYGHAVCSRVPNGVWMNDSIRSLRSGRLASRSNGSTLRGPVASSIPLTTASRSSGSPVRSAALSVKIKD